MRVRRYVRQDVSMTNGKFESLLATALQDLREVCFRKWTFCLI